jgi:hypothetical protein
LHHFGQSLIGLRRDQQMQVVVHQHKSVQIDLLVLAMPHQQLKQDLPVAVVLEDQLTVVAAQNHVVRVTG